MAQVHGGTGTLRRVPETPVPDPGDDDWIVINAGHPGVPGRGPVVLAFLGVVVAGIFGGMIGYGLADVSCEGDCGGALAIGAVVGAALAAAGVGVVAVLVLRAMVEWRRTPPGDPMVPIDQVDSVEQIEPPTPS